MEGLSGRRTRKFVESQVGYYAVDGDSEVLQYHYIFSLEQLEHIRAGHLSCGNVWSILLRSLEGKIDGARFVRLGTEERAVEQGVEWTMFWAEAGKYRWVHKN